MVNTLSYYWWAFALRGLAALVFGLLAFLWPGITLTVLVYWFGAYALWDGVFGIISAVRQRGEKKRWWALVLEGVVGIIAAIIAFLMPGLTALVVVYLIASWAMLTGIFEIISAIRLRKDIEKEPLFCDLTAIPTPAP